MGNGGNGVQWVWAMGPMGNVDTGGNGVTGDMGHMGNEADRGKVIHGVWGAEVWGIWAMRPHRGYGAQGYGPHGQ